MAVALTDPGDIDFRTDGARSFSDYWGSLPRTDEGVPSRQSFDPAAIAPLLPHVILHDLSDNEHSILRIVGTGLVERFGFDPTGRDYGSLVSPSRRQTALAALKLAAGHPCGIHAVIEWRYQTGYRELAEAVGYPLLSRNGAGRLMIFVDIPVETIGYDDVPSEGLRALGVLERRMIDIGFGAPAWAGDQTYIDGSDT